MSKDSYLPLPGAILQIKVDNQLKKQQKWYKQYKGKLIYGDTDSVIHFPDLNTSEECWDYSLQIEKEVSNLFQNLWN